MSTNSKAVASTKGGSKLGTIIALLVVIVLGKLVADWVFGIVGAGILAIWLIRTRAAFKVVNRYTPSQEAKTWLQYLVDDAQYGSDGRTGAALSEYVGGLWSLNALSDVIWSFAVILVLLGFATNPLYQLYAWPIVSVVAIVMAWVAMTQKVKFDQWVRTHLDEKVREMPIFTRIFALAARLVMLAYVAGLIGMKIGLIK